MRRIEKEGLIDDVRMVNMALYMGELEMFREMKSVTSRGEPFFVSLNQSRKIQDEVA